jgi:hypothetical protein
MRKDECFQEPKRGPLAICLISWRISARKPAHTRLEKGEDRQFEEKFLPHKAELYRH